MPPVRTLLFLVPLVKALRPSTTPAKQLSTASSMKARVASQKAVWGGQQQLLAGLTLFWEPPHFLSLGSVLLVNFVRLTVSCLFFVFVFFCSTHFAQSVSPVWASPPPPSPSTPALHQQSASPGVHRLVRTSSLIVCVCVPVFWKNSPFLFFFWFGLMFLPVSLSRESTLAP